MSKIKRIRDLLVSIPDLKVYHYWRPRLEAPFCLWQEDGEGDSLHSNNKKSEQVITGSIDYYTKTEYDSMVDNIQEALNNAECVAWNLDSVDYEEETNLIHYSWSFEIA